MPRRSKPATSKQANAIYRLEQRINSLLLSKKPKKKSSRSRRSRATSSQSTLRLSGVAAKFFHANVDPFHTSLNGAYIPDAQCRPSLKQALRTRFSVSAGAGAITMIQMMPYVVSDRHCLMYGPGAVGSTLQAMASNFADWQGCLFTRADLDSKNLNYRVVSYAVKVAYTGPPLGRGGYALFAEDTTGEGLFASLELTGASTVTDLINAVTPMTTTRYATFATNGEHEFVVHPYLVANNTDPANPSGHQGMWHAYGTGLTDYTGSATPCRNLWSPVSGGQTLVQPQAALVLSNPTGAATEFMVDVIMHVEYNGQSISSLQTQSPPDVQHVGSVSAAVQQAKSVHHKDPNRQLKNIGNTILHNLYGAGEKITSEVSEFASSKAVQAVERRIAASSASEVAEMALVAI